VSFALCAVWEPGCIGNVASGFRDLAQGCQHPPLAKTRKERATRFRGSVGRHPPMQLWVAAEK